MLCFWILDNISDFDIHTAWNTISHLQNTIYLPKIYLFLNLKLSNLDIFNFFNDN